MAHNPLALAQQQAARDNAALARLFAQYIGSAEHPRGRILAAYRVHRPALAEALRQPESWRRVAVAHEVLDSLRRDWTAIGDGLLLAAMRGGGASAQAQLRYYQIAGEALPYAGDVPDIGPLLTAWGTIPTSQWAMIEAVLLAGGDPAQILGAGPDNLGLFNPAPAAREAARWAAIAALAGFSAWLIGRDGRGETARYQKQAIAAIDQRTTDCCLRVHGQIQPLEKPFRLTGEPRFADKLDWPPFHWWCRTSAALYVARFDEGLTTQMQTAARREITARRETGTRRKIWPSHARSERG